MRCACCALPPRQQDAVRNEPHRSRLTHKYAAPLPSAPQWKFARPSCGQDLVTCVRRELRRMELETSRLEYAEVTLAEAQGPLLLALGPQHPQHFLRGREPLHHLAVGILQQA